eukprot:1145415-Pelagomonas_calceolata.AAC.4
MRWLDALGCARRMHLLTAAHYEGMTRWVDVHQNVRHMRTLVAAHFGGAARSNMLVDTQGCAWWPMHLLTAVRCRDATEWVDVKSIAPSVRFVCGLCSRKGLWVVGRALLLHRDLSHSLDISMPFEITHPQLENTHQCVLLTACAGGDMSMDISMPKLKNPFRRTAPPNVGEGGVVSLLSCAKTLIEQDAGSKVRLAYSLFTIHGASALCWLSMKPAANPARTPSRCKQCTFRKFPLHALPEKCPDPAPLLG